MERREFIQRTSLLGAGLLLSPSIIRAGRMPVSPNDKIHVGLIGCNSMGFSDLSAFLHNSEVECVALAFKDVQLPVRDRDKEDTTREPSTFRIADLLSKMK